jgi:hypothetical protein
MGRARAANGPAAKDRADIAAEGTASSEPTGDAASHVLGAQDASGLYAGRARVGGVSPATTPPVGSVHLPPRFPPFRENYNDMGELRRELKVLSVQMNLPYYMHHSSPQRLEARCPTWKHRKDVPTSCEFVVAANRHTNGRVYVTRAVVAHSATCPSVQQSGNYVSAAALMETAKPFMVKIADSVKPRDMANIMKEKFGVSTSYMTAWRALTAFKQEKKHEETSSFAKIAGYLDAFVQSNDGSVAAFEQLPDQPAGSHVFSRAFLCPKPLQSALPLCRSQLLLSVFLITSLYGGVVMTATAQDSMGDNVPIAVGIALGESEENWRFFLEKLREAIPNLDGSISTLVHNRGPILQLAAASVFPKCAQSDAVDTFFSPPQLMPATAAAAAAATAAASVGAAAPPPPQQNSLQWVETLCGKTPLMILVGWVSKVASTLFQRFEKYGSMSSEYPEEFHALLTQYEAEAGDYEIVRISEHGYEVIDTHTGRQRIVDFAKQSCTCGEYEPSRFPCIHVFLAVSFAGMLRADVIPEIFLMKSLKALYAGRVTPIDVDTVVSDGVTVPHPLPKARGRPRKVQPIQQFTDVKHDKLACSICGVKGHNKRTCKRLTPGSTGGLLGGITGVDGEDQGFLQCAYPRNCWRERSGSDECVFNDTDGEAVFAGDMVGVQGGEVAATTADDGSPSSKRRKIGRAEADGLTEASVV